MDITNLKKVLPLLMKHRVVPFLWGNQGIGKTQLMRQLAKTMECGFVHLHVATQEVGDLVGLPITENGITRHARPTWMPTEGKGIIFLDELNRAHPDVLQAMFSFVIDGTIHTHKLPEGWRIVAAGNYQNNSFNVTDTSDAAWLSRFCHLDVEPTVAEFITFAESMKADTVAGFIRDHGTCLEAPKAAKLDKSFITPDRRAWLDGIARLENEDLGEHNTFEIYAGLVGTTAAASFVSWKRDSQKGFSIKDILSQYHSKPSLRKEVKKASTASAGETRLDLLNSAVAELSALLQATPDFLEKPNYVDNLKDFILDIPRELGIKVLKDLSSIKTFAGRDSILNEPKFVSDFTSLAKKSHDKQAKDSLAQKK